MKTSLLLVTACIPELVPPLHMHTCKQTFTLVRNIVFDSLDGVVWDTCRRRIFQPLRRELQQGITKLNDYEKLQHIYH